MMESDWKKILRRGASLHHMCEENRTALENCDTKSEAIALYKKTIDWALEEGYPDLSVIENEFSDCEDDGVFVNKHFSGEVLNEQQVYVFHNCTGYIRTGINVQKKNIPMLYFSNGCDMTIKASDAYGLSTRVPLYVFGDNNIKYERSEDITCKLYKFNVK